MKQQISILGCGWLGEPLACSLIEKGFLVKGSTTSEVKLPILSSKKIQAFLLNIENITTTVEAFLTAKILIVNIPSKNVEGFKTLVSYIEKSEIEKVIFISSTSVYEISEEIITENTPVKNCDLVEIENLFKLNTNFKTTIIRFAGLLGYNRKPGNFFRNGKTIPNPEGFVNMIHQDDCISIIQQIIFQNCWGEIFNACTDTHPKRRDFYQKSFSDIGLKLPVFNENDTKEVKIISNQKLKNKLNYTFKYANLLNLPLEN
ncbi:dTDP-glucose 4,6-dehydratase [Lutibacter sp. HS1-25]|uniref:dTDP-glucose 4,6-dehydratase n=1 Tax=Lutibacter sp. HS1-25 TaxID=2485000 RepID=UPI0010107255|nr:dTDP-glucose 4,6-dehydratase [Lutibacter sp. HS1-25]RXP54257.1 dTDP-glucose 4,6-dehydratase [Lutibacter sp. HS1-25]